MTTSGRLGDWKLCLASLSVIAIAHSGDYARAQITPDTTLGSENSTVTSIGSVDQINGGATRGANLFHSFQEFNVGNGRAAFFTNPTGIENILSRVTGANRSNILGTLGVSGGNANLFLINPNGIIFGPSSRLDIRGSFIASTASSLNFTDGTQFSATAPPPIPLLRVSVPIGLQFGGTAGSIRNLSQATNSRGEPVGLQVLPGKTLALVGGDVRMEGGNLFAPGGRVELGGVAGAGTVGLNVDGNNLRLSFPDDITRADVSLTNRALVNASGLGGGNIQVDGRRVTLTDGSRIASFNFGSQPGGTLTVNASESVELTGTGEFLENVQQLALGTVLNPFDLPNGIFTGSFLSGAGGDIMINTPNFIARNGAFVTTYAFRQGQGGDLTVNSAEFVELSASALATASGLLATGDAGNLTINTRQLIARENGFATTSTLGRGKGGTLTVRASESVELIGSDPLLTSEAVNFIPITGNYSFNTGLYTVSFTAGKAGDLQVETGRLILRDGAIVSASTNGSGQGGNITVTAPKSVELIGRTPNGKEYSLLAAASGDGAIGSAGSVTIATGNLIIQDGGTVTVSSFGTGNAGNLEVAAGSIRLEDLGRLQADSSAGEGNIMLRSQTLVLRRGSSITTNATGTATGGNITIRTGVIAALENSDISASALEGPGGRIRINAQGIFGTEFREEETSQSDIRASSNLGPDFSGIVEINTSVVDPSLGLVSLPAELVDASGLIASGCGGSGRQGESEFIVTGRGGLPPNPSDPLSSETVWSDLRPQTRQAEKLTNSESVTQSLNPTAVPLVEAQGWVINNKGEVVLTASAPTVRPHSLWQTPATCHAP